MKLKIHKRQPKRDLGDKKSKKTQIHRPKTSDLEKAKKFKNENTNDNLFA